MKYDFKNKTANLNQLNNYMIAKTLSMFEWQGLPDTIPVKELEKLLQLNGYAFITKVNGELYALSGGLGGVPDAYNNPTEITISNPYLKFNKTLSLKDDGILITNDDLAIGLLPLYHKYNAMILENDINMMLYGYSTRMKTVISASDDKTKASAESYIKKVIDGDVSIIGENAFFDGVKVQTAHSSQGSSVSGLIELQQYLKGSLFNEVGLSANFNMKKERLITSEIDQQNDGLFPLVFNMMKCRLIAVDKINEKYDLSISVDFGSVWASKSKELVDGITDDNEPVEGENELLNEPLDEPLNEPLDEPLHEPTDESDDTETEKNDDTDTTDKADDNDPDSNPDKSDDTDSGSDNPDSVVKEQIELLDDIAKDTELSEDDREVLEVLKDELKEGLEDDNA